MPKIVSDEEIYQAVIQVVSERGYAGATTKQMAELANVSEVTLFRKYGSKLQLIRQAIDSLVAHSNFPTQIQSTGDLQTDLLGVVRTYQESAVRHGQFIFMILAEMPRDPEVTTLLNAPLGIFTGLAQLIRQYQAEGALKPENPMHALITLLGPLIYVSMLGKAMGEDVVPPLDLELHVRHFLEGRRA